MGLRARGLWCETVWFAAGADDFCKLSDGQTLRAKPAMQMKKVVYIESGNERAVMEALAKHGPLSIGIDADCIPFRFYSSGVLDTTECTMDPENIDHAVLLVGYGEEAGALHRKRCCALNLIAPCLVAQSHTKKTGA